MAEVVSFGCRINSFESEILKEKFADMDNLIIVNTCAVTKEAERQCRQTVRKLRKNNPQAKIVVTGCAAQINPKTFAEMQEVDLVLGNKEKTALEQYVYGSISEKTIVGDIFDYDKCDDYVNSTRVQSSLYLLHYSFCQRKQSLAARSRSFKPN